MYTKNSCYFAVGIHVLVYESLYCVLGVENAMQKFLELSKKTEAFFLRKRMLISFTKPELVIAEVGVQLLIIECSVFTRGLFNIHLHTGLGSV